MVLKRVLAVACVVPLFTLGAQQSPKGKYTGRVQGTVEHPRTGKALPGAIITVTAEDDSVAAATVTTDENGRFAVPALPVGVYHLVTMHPSLDSASLARRSLNFRLTRGGTLSLTLGQQRRVGQANGPCGENPIDHPASIEILGPERPVGYGAAKVVPLRPGYQGIKTQYALVDGCQ